MKKELNPEIFGDYRGTTSSSVLDPLHSDQEVYLRDTSSSGNRSTEAHFISAAKQILDLKTQIQLITEQMNRVVLTLNESNKTIHSKFEKIQQVLLKMDQSYNGLTSETGKKLNQLETQLADRAMMETKIQEMVDRHNNVVHNFEVRMGQVQRILAEKEAQQISTQSALNEARMEMARLKGL